MILLDTNVLIRVMRGDEAVGRHYCENLGDLAIPAMVLGELRYGVEKSERREANERLLDALLESLPVMHTTDAIMRRFAELKALLDGKGKRIDDADVLIAATALTYGCPLVTANVRHFSRFDGLELLNWSV